MKRERQYETVMSDNSNSKNDKDWESEYNKEIAHVCELERTISNLESEVNDLKAKVLYYQQQNEDQQKTITYKQGVIDGLEKGINLAKLN